MRGLAVVRTGRAPLTALGLLLVVLTVPVSAALARSAAGSAWAVEINGVVRERPGFWLVMRDSMEFALIPGSLAVLTVMLLVTYRRSPQRAGILAAVFLLANLTVQAVKHPPFGWVPPWSDLNPLSGHVGVVGGLVLGWLVASTSGGRLRSATVALGGLVAVSLGTLLAGWHTPFQVWCSTGIITGWAIVGAAWVPSPSGREPRAARLQRMPRAAGRMAGVLGVAGVLGLGVVAPWVAGHPGSWDLIRTSALVLGALGVVSGAVLATSVVLGAVAEVGPAASVDPGGLDPAPVATASRAWKRRTG